MDTPAPILSYQLNPSPSSLMASPANPAAQGYNQSVLLLTASNDTNQPVTLAYLRLSLPLGAGATSLFDASHLPAVAATPDPAWTLFKTTVFTDDNQQQWASYLFHPRGTGTLPAESSWTFSWEGVPPFRGVPINSVPGKLLCQVAEGSTDSPTLALPLNKAPAGWFEPTFSASPTQAQSGATVLLTWNGPAGARYGLNGLGPDAPNPLPNAGACHSVALTQDTTFTLNVDYTSPQGQPYHASPQQSVTVAAKKPFITSFTGQILPTDTGIELLLTWEVGPIANPPVQVFITGRSDSLAPAGSWPIYPTVKEKALSTYVLTVINDAGSVTQRLTAEWAVVNSPVPVMGSFSSVAITSDGTQALVLSNKGVVPLARQGQGNWAIADSPIPIDFSPNCIGITPYTTQALVPGSFDDCNITVLTRVATGGWAITSSVPSSPMAGVVRMAITPDGKQAFMLCSNSIMVVFSSTDGKQWVKSDTITTAQAQGPFVVAFTSDGTQALITTETGVVMVFTQDGGKWTHVSDVPLSPKIFAIAITPDGTQALVANYDEGTVTVLVSGTKGQWTVAGSPIPVGQSPMSLVITRDGTQVLIPDATGNTGDVKVLTQAANGQWAITDTIASLGQVSMALANTPDGTQALVMTNAGLVTMQISKYSSPVSIQ